VEGSLVGKSFRNKFIQPVYYSFQVGRQLIRVISDGTATMQMDKLLGNVSAESLAEVLADNFLSNVLRSSINSFIMETDGEVIMIDTGAGDLIGKNSDHLLENIKSVGYTPEDITAVRLRIFMATIRAD
jgi:glyoxylase-like metal-dependent hydrolase (beta-lactamase superfamily II)